MFSGFLIGVAFSFTFSTSLVLILAWTHRINFEDENNVEG
jgi:hypothetical protein